jgi:hypothetical protein
MACDEVSFNLNGHHLKWTRFAVSFIRDLFCNFGLCSVAFDLNPDQMDII